MSPEVHYRFELGNYLARIREIHASIPEYQEALEEAIESLQEELSAVVECQGALSDVTD